MGLAHYLFWIVVSLFVVIFVVTLLGLTGRISIPPLYLKILFTKVVVGIVGALFFLFYQLFGLEFVPQKVYPFDSRGEPTSLEVRMQLLEYPVKKFDALSTEEYKPVQRSARVEKNKLYVTTKDGHYYLGYVDAPKQELSRQLMDTRTALALGLHLSEKENGQRRDPDQAATYLLQALTTEEESSDNVKRRAVIGLHYLLQYLDVNEFRFLISKINQYREGHNRDVELGDTYMVYARKERQNTQEKYKAALRYYLRFLSSPASASDELSAKRESVIRNTKTIMDIYLSRVEYIRSEKQHILQAIEANNHAALLAYSNNIPLPDFPK